jgi:hypothetical protein
MDYMDSLLPPICQCGEPCSDSGYVAVVLRILANTGESFDTQVPLSGITSVIQAISKARQDVQAGHMNVFISELNLPRHVRSLIGPCSGCRVDAAV